MDHKQLIEQTFLQQVVWLESIDSTNSYALKVCTSDAVTPYLIGAESQTSGRGRGRNAWWSGSGALTFSLILRPEKLGIHLSQWPLLSLNVGLAACQTLEQSFRDLDVRLKWPNDVYVNAKKIGGILIESVPNATGLLVVGMGINVNNSLAEAPLDVQQNAVSLIDLAGQKIDREALLIALLKNLEKELRSLAENDQQQADRWRSRCFLTNRIVMVSEINSETIGTCLGVDEEGALQLLTEAGVKRFFAGTVRCLD